jgi:hypothetical protein
MNDDALITVLLLVLFLVAVGIGIAELLMNHADKKEADRDGRE